MEEISWGAKALVLLVCAAILVGLVGWNKIFKKKGS